MDELITLRMLSLSNKDNVLSLLVREENLNARKSYFRSIEVFEIDFFPQLDHFQLHLYTCGPYHIKTTRSHYADHLNKAGDFQFEVSAETIHIDYRKYKIDLGFMNGILFKARLGSKHSNSVKYFIYVLVDKTVTGINAIIGHTCNCKVGKRIVGCCSHVATLIWFFSKARFLDTIPIPAQHLSGYFDAQSISESEADTDDGHWTYSFQ